MPVPLFNLLSPYSTWRQEDHRADKSDQSGTGQKGDTDCGKTFEPILMAMTHFNTEQNSKEIIRRMICGNEFEKTRNCYASRCLGYAQIDNGDFAIVADISGWIAAIKETASNLPQIIDILSQWKASTSKSNDFVIWVHSL